MFNYNQSIFNLEEQSFYVPQFAFENKESKEPWESIFSTKSEQHKLSDSLSFEEIKSTEEISHKENNDDSCFSNVAEEDDEFIEEFVETDPLISKLCLEVREKIYNNEIACIIDEAIECQFDNQFKIDFQPLIQIKNKKTSSQKVFLEKALVQNPEWTKEFMNKLAVDLGLKARQVYKWHWDKTKKNQSPKNKRKQVPKSKKFEDIEFSLGFIGSGM